MTDIEKETYNRARQYGGEDDQNTIYEGATISASLLFPTRTADRIAFLGMVEPWERFWGEIPKSELEVK